MSKNILIITDSIIKERTAVHGNNDPKLLYPSIKTAQDLFLEPILGSKLFNKILDDIDNDTLIDPYLSLVRDYIIDPLMYFALSKAVLQYSYQIFNVGMVRLAGDSIQQPPIGELVYLANGYKQDAEVYAERLKKYLQQEKDNFPEYYENNGRIDDITPTSDQFTLPLLLNGSLGCNCNRWITDDGICRC